MIVRAPRCTSCKIDLDADAERCPHCLRKSSVIGTASEAGDAPSAKLGSARHVGIRAVILVGAYVVYGPIVVVGLSRRPWLEEEHVILPAMFALLMLATMPLRMAFAPLDHDVDTRAAAREYALRMVMVLAMAGGTFVAMFVASRITENPVAATLLGLFLFLSTVLAGDALSRARREKTSVRAALLASARKIGLAAVLVTGLAGLLALRALHGVEPAEKPSFTVPADPSALGELFDPQHLHDVAVDQTWLRDADGRETLHLAADAGDFERSLQKLSVAVAGRWEDVARRPNASGVIRLWLPVRFDDGQHLAAAQKEQSLLQNALAAKRTTGSRPIVVAIAFGAAPATPRP